MEKKGLAAVVGTILIILLVIVAVGIIWAVASGLFKSGAEEMSTGFLIDLDIKSASLSGTTVTVNVERNVGAGTLSGIKFVFSDGESSKGEERSTSMDELDQESFSFDISSETGLGIPDAHEVSIAPIYKSESGEDILKNIVDRAEFRDAVNGGGEPPGDGADCGNGIIETGETCDDNNIVSGDGCSSSCNVETGWSCVGEPSVCTEVGGGGCLTSANCTDLGYQCGEHDDWCGGTFVCGPCDPGQVCNATYLCESALVLSGTIDSVWPGDAPRYFDSSQLPIDGNESDLVLKYINFSNPAETGCIKIVGAEHVYNSGPPVYDRTHLELERVTNITSLYDYQIWESSTCGV